MNGHQHGFSLLKHLIVPIPQDDIALAAKPRVALPIRLASVLAAVGFEHELVFHADEIDDVRAKRHLAFELQAQETVGTEVVPQSLLCLGHAGS
jgi:hypothetical protein